MPKRTDQNQTEIVKAFRQLGASVQIISDIGKGCPDIIVGFAGKNYLIEIKNDKKPPSGQRLTEHEEIFFNNWRGQVSVIKSIAETVAFVNGIHV